MSRTLALVLGGGRGTRLFPLTELRSKPAVPLGGKYRLIDIPLSNCIHSGITQIYVLTQFNSVSLHRHIRRTYQFDSFSDGFVELLAAQQTLDNSNWYQGTADAVRQNIRYIQQGDYDYVLILSGDQLYRMDYNTMIETHIKAKADVTIATLPVDEREAAAFGIMRLDDTGRVVGFLEKPKTEDELKLVRTDPAWMDAHGINSKGRTCLASMGMYLFPRDLLLEVLEKTNYQDFGNEVFPAVMRTHRVQVHMFDGYWEDIGTIKAFYEANLALAQPNPPFQMVSADAPIYTRARFLPPAHIDGAMIKNSLIADGCKIEEGAKIENSVIGLRCHIGRNAVIRNSVIMGQDYFENDADIAACNATRPPLGIGADALIDGALIDKNCRIGKGVKLVNEKKVDTLEAAGGPAMIIDGIVCVPKESTVPNGWKL